jgi:hypothetical protein
MNVILNPILDNMLSEGIKPQLEKALPFATYSLTCTKEIISQ